MKDLLLLIAWVLHIAVLAFIMYVFITWFVRKIQGGTYEYNSEKGIREYHPNGGQHPAPGRPAPPAPLEPLLIFHDDGSVEFTHIPNKEK